MGVAESTGYCVNCEQAVLIRAKTPKHILHLILSILTSGLWLIIWAVLLFKEKEWLCSHCGQPAIEQEPGKEIKVCEGCGTKNRPIDYLCKDCGRPL